MSRDCLTLPSRTPATRPRSWFSNLDLREASLACSRDLQKVTLSYQSGTYRLLFCVKATAQAARQVDQGMAWQRWEPPGLVHSMLEAGHAMPEPNKGLARAQLPTPAYVPFSPGLPLISDTPPP